MSSKQGLQRSPQSPQRSSIHFTLALRRNPPPCGNHQTRAHVRAHGILPLGAEFRSVREDLAALRVVEAAHGPVRGRHTVVDARGGAQLATRKMEDAAVSLDHVNFALLCCTTNDTVCNRHAKGIARFCQALVLGRGRHPVQTSHTCVPMIMQAYLHCTQMMVGKWCM